MLFISVLIFLIYRNFIICLGIIIGILSHLIADSFAITGVMWLYPYKKDDKFYFGGYFDMSRENSLKTERKIQSILLLLLGFLC